MTPRNPFGGLSPQQVAKRLPVVYAAVDRAIAIGLREGKAAGEVPSCGSGCAGCCHTRMFLPTEEAECLTAAVAKSGGLVGLTELGRRAAANIKATGPAPPGGAESKEFDHPYFKARVPCPLLNIATQTCSQYAARPTVCRAYFSMSPPNECEWGGKPVTMQFVDVVRFAGSMMHRLSRRPPEIADLNVQLLLAVRRRGVEVKDA